MICYSDADRLADSLADMGNAELLMLLGVGEGVEALLCAAQQWTFTGHLWQRKYCKSRELMLLMFFPRLGRLACGKRYRAIAAVVLCRHPVCSSCTGALTLCCVAEAVHVGKLLRQASPDCCVAAYATMMQMQAEYTTAPSPTVLL